MKTVSSDFTNAFASSTMAVKAKAVVEFGNNRFNDDQVCAASSTKVADRGISGSIKGNSFSFWSPDDAFNNKNRNTMRWGVCDRGAQADGSYRAIYEDYNQSDGPVYERGWWSANKATPYDPVADLNWQNTSLDTSSWPHAVQSIQDAHNVPLGGWFGVDSSWSDPNAHWIWWQPGGTTYDATQIVGNWRTLCFWKQLVAPVTGTYDVWAACDDAGYVYINGTEVISGAGFGAVSHATVSLTAGQTVTIFVVAAQATFQAGFVLTLWNASSGYVGSTDNTWKVQPNIPSFFSSPEWVQSTWPIARNINQIDLWLTEGYPNMRKITVQYYNATTAAWVDVVTNYSLGTSYYYSWQISEVLCSGLRVYVHETQGFNDYARISELQGLFVADVSNDIISCNVSQDREEYVNTVPVGTTRADTLNLQLQNVDQQYSPENTSSAYYPYITANNKINVSYGIDIGGGTYEYTPMGVFYTDTWQVDGDGLTASATCRDFSKFMQDEKVLKFGKIWTYSTIARVLTDVLARLGKGPDEIHIDPLALRTFDLLFLKDKIIWAFIAEVAFADQGMFGFGENGDFFYQSYQIFNYAPYTSSIYSLDGNTNVVSAQEETELYVNSVVTKISDYSLSNTTRNVLWQAPDNVILSWAHLNGSLNSTETNVINVFPSDNLDDPNQFWLPTGYLCIDNEIIQYDSRTSSTFNGLTRGILGTQPATHNGGSYMGDCRVFTLNYDNAPALWVDQPFVSAIDEMQELYNQTFARILIFEPDNFGAILAISNLQQRYTILQGQGAPPSAPTDDSYQWITALAGNIITPKQSVEEVGGPPIGKTSSTNKWSRYIRRYGKNEIAVENPWIQTREHANFITNLLIDEYKNPRQIISGKMVGYPALQLADRFTLISYPQLSISNRDYNFISLRYTYDGGLVCDFMAREVKQ